MGITQRWPYCKMLPPDYLATLGDALLPLYEEYQTALINDMARRIAKIGVSDASVWQIMAYQEAGGVFNDAMSHLAQLTGQTQQELRAAFEDAGAKAIAYDSAVYRAAGLTPVALNQSPAMLQVLLGGLQKTEGTLKNWTMTTAVTSQHAFLDAVDKAYMLVSGGGMSYQQAITQAIRGLAEDGLYVLYPSGHRDKIDVAVRRATLTGVNQTAGQIQIAFADIMGCDLLETTAHMGARTGNGIANHAGWQGRVFSRTGNGYPHFVDTTGYGEGAGLCGWNCRHSFYPYFEGISSPAFTAAQLDAMRDASVMYGGEEIPWYEATQMQREIEREIRKMKRELLAYQSAENASYGDEPAVKALREAYVKDAAKLSKQRAELKGFLEQTGLRVQNDRAQVAGFGRSEAQKAVWAARTIQPKVFSAPNTALQETLGSSIIVGVVPKGATLEHVVVMAGAGSSVPLRAAQELTEQFGGKPSQWQKKGGTISTGNYAYEVHWEEWDGKQYRLKIKGVKAK